MTVDYDGIIIIDAYSGIPLFSKIKNIDDTLFSGFITAIRKFSEELSLGSLSSFSTDEKHIFLVAREKIVVAIITNIEIEFQKIYSFASKIAHKFEDKFNLDNNVSEVSIFDGFILDLNEIENESSIPFKVKVAEFVSKEMGSKIGLDVNLFGNDGKEHVIDIVVDNGKKSVGRLRDKRLRKMISAFSSDIFFVKIIDGTAGKAETIDFINSMQKFGTRTDDGVFPYFPSKAVIIAKDYSPTVIEELSNFPKKQNRIYISGTHITLKSNLKISPESSKCFIELWQWYDNKYPERIFS